MLAGRLVEIGPAARVTGQPGHPYTRSLIAGARGRREAPASHQGNGDSAGCPFLNRCAQGREACRLDRPGPVNLDSSHHLAWCLYPLNGGGTECGGEELMVNSGMTPEEESWRP